MHSFFKLLLANLWLKQEEKILIQKINAGVESLL